MGRPRDLSFTLQSIWHLPTLVNVAILSALMLTFWRDPFYLEEGEGDRVEARVTSLSSAGYRYQGRWPGLSVTVRTDDGAFETTTALPQDEKGYKVGEPIVALRTGLKLYRHPSPSA